MKHGLTIRAFSKQFFDKPAVLRAVNKAQRKVLSRFGAFVRTRAKTSIRKRKGTSPAGSPPFSHEGSLRKFILFAYDAETKAVVIGPARLSKLGQAPEALEQGGFSQGYVGTEGNRRLKRTRIQARPYMGPAFQAELRQLPPQWLDSLHQGP